MDKRSNEKKERKEMTNIIAVQFTEVNISSEKKSIFYILSVKM